MKETHLFEYIPSRAPLCRLDPLVKLLALIIICITSAALEPPFIFLYLPAFIPLFAIAGRGAILQLGGMWKLYIFFILSGAVKYLSSSSLIEGAAFSSLMFTMFFSGLLFYSTTRISEFRKAAARVFHHIPLINGERLADLISMTMAFLPLIFKTSTELGEAEYSRALRPGRKPLRSLKIKTIPLMINLFIKSEKMADAYYSRCFGHEIKK